MPQHTPGSWTFSRTPTYWKICHPSLSTMKGPKVLAIVHHTNPSAEHDARLISAATELLAEIVKLHAFCRETNSAYRNGIGGTDPLYSSVRAAINKATGEAL